MGSLHQSLVEKNSCWSLRTSTPDNLNWQLDIRPISLLRGVPCSCISALSIFAKKSFKQSYFPPSKTNSEKNFKKKENLKEEKLPSCLLAVNVPHFAGAFFQSTISGKPCTDAALDNIRNASRHP